jgi:quercetin dioxygenase-like cupin family protein
MSQQPQESRQARIMLPEEGRDYDMGRMQATFYADGEETAQRYSISEWSLDPFTEGPGAHAHPEDHIFYVLSGIVSLVIDGQRSDAPQGAYAVIPGGIQHDFENHTAKPCRFISLNSPAGFEQMMPRLVAWFADNPLGDARER